LVVLIRAGAGNSRKLKLVVVTDWSGFAFIGSARKTRNSKLLNTCYLCEYEVHAAHT
jgi:hypothetical protein